jgi:hypothetical protein
LESRGKKLIAIKAIIGNHWQSLTIIDNQQAIKAIWAIKNSAFSPLISCILRCMNSKLLMIKQTFKDFNIDK